MQCFMTTSIKMFSRVPLTTSFMKSCWSVWGISWVHSEIYTNKLKFKSTSWKWWIQHVYIYEHAWLISIIKKNNFFLLMMDMLLILIRTTFTIWIYQLVQNYSKSMYFMMIIDGLLILQATINIMLFDEYINENCLICQRDVIGDLIITKMSCSHMFHVNFIKIWLEKK